MKAAIARLEISLENLTTNEPIHRAEGNIEQADMEKANIAEIKEALAVLRGVEEGAMKLQTRTSSPRTGEPETIMKKKLKSDSPLRAATCSPSSRALVCCFCGKAWSYDGTAPKEPLLKEAYEHEAVCEKNPYLAKITELVTTLHEISGLCERAWEGAIVGKHIRNHAKRVLSKYPHNSQADRPNGSV